jgi:hypothetical protein
MTIERKRSGKIFFQKILFSFDIRKSRIQTGRKYNPDKCQKKLNPISNTNTFILEDHYKRRGRKRYAYRTPSCFRRKKHQNHHRRARTGNFRACHHHKRIIAYRTHHRNTPPHWVT